jgi:hypothetical protein
MLKADPAAAAAALEQARRVMAVPGMAEAMLQAPRVAAAGGDAYRRALESLRDDPSIKPVFDDIAANGMTALERWWDDKDVMSKIAARVREQTAAVPGTPKEGAPTKGVVPAAVDDAASSSLHAAAKAGDAAAVAALLADGADPAAPDARGVTPLGVAVGHGHADAATALLDGGAAVDGRDGRGNTPLHYAAGYGRTAIVTLLLARGADAGAANDAGQTPVDVAGVNGEREVVAALRGAGKEEEEVFVR